MGLDPTKLSDRQRAMKKRTKRKRPSSDSQREVATGCRELLSGVAGLTKPNFHKLNMRAGRNDRLLHAVLCAYAKHNLDCEDIGWSQLGDLLHNAICNEIGDEACIAWSDQMKDEMDSQKPYADDP